MTNEVQSKFTKSTIYIVVGILLLGFILIQPYNIFCRIKKTCSPITLSSFSFKEVGVNKMTINFTAQTPEGLVDIVKFETKASSLEILNGKKIINSYLVKNLSKENITVGANFDLKPEGVGEYLERTECICQQTTPLNVGEEKPMLVNFRINPDIEKDAQFKDIKEIEVLYKVRLVK